MHYHFVDDAEFDRLVEAGELLEWAVVHGRARYGTPRGPVERALSEGQLAMLEIDLQGARQVRESLPGTLFASSCPRRGRSWCAGWSVGAPRPRRNGSGACRPRGTSWRPRRSSMWSSSTTMFGERAKNSYHGCERVSAPSDAAHRQPRAMHVETTPSAKENTACPEPWPTPSGSPTRRSTTCSRPPTRKYALVIYSAKRARQINAYYCQLREGLLEYVGPLVETARSREAAVDRAA